MAANVMLENHIANMSDANETIGDENSEVDKVQDTKAGELQASSVYGAKEGGEVGTIWKSKVEYSATGMHKSIDTDTHEGPDGACSIALCGNIDHIDHGECFTCTSEDVRRKVAELKDGVCSEVKETSRTTGSQINFPMELEGICSKEIIVDTDNNKLCPDICKSVCKEVNSKTGADLCTSIVNMRCGYEMGSSKVRSVSPMYIEPKVKESLQTDVIDTNDNEVQLKAISSEPSDSLITAQANDNVQSCMKKLKPPLKKNVTFKVDSKRTKNVTQTEVAKHIYKTSVTQTAIVKHKDNFKICKYSMEDSLLEKLNFKCKDHKPKFKISEVSAYVKSSSNDMKIKLVKLKPSSSLLLSDNREINVIEGQNKKNEIISNNINVGFDNETLKASSLPTASKNIAQRSVGQTSVTITNFDKEMEVKLDKMISPVVKMKRLKETLNVGNGSPIQARVSPCSPILVPSQRKAAKRRKSTSDTEDVSSKKNKRLIRNRDIFLESCASDEHPKTAIRKPCKKKAFHVNTNCSAHRKKISSVVSSVKRSTDDSIDMYLKKQYEKQFGPLNECEVRIEKISLDCSSALLGDKEQKNNRQSGAKIVIRSSHSKHKNNNSLSVQKSSSIDFGVKQNVKIEESLILDQENENLKKYDTWGKDGIDSWGNVRYISKESDSQNSCDDWCGWMVHIDSLGDTYNANLLSISDGKTESRIVVWNDTLGTQACRNDNSVQVPEQTKYLCNCDDSNKKWAGWNVLFVNLKI